MNNKRINRISEEVKKVISELLYNGLKDPRVTSMTTVTDVKVTRDLSFANIYISVLGDKKEKEDCLKGLQSAKGFIRSEIGKRVDLRHIPEPIFHLDETLEHASHITDLIEKVKMEDNNRGIGNE
ncbi:30S ribosome-binding factor RbfA [Tissierella creatinophila]|uniref:Ribosome-binding factor A n=1 Tax=Tissierella creatinophila DSM 6911 TaxID=1123403 RepID=A0A1U7M364_TISCR|nr:30S ribosome-binding factor RbfA [Tissierella creatinophila]OLS01763.1 ribosome-binding factor A [Tissierella creatinophila DSM 6911]